MYIYIYRYRYVSMYARAYVYLRISRQGGDDAQYNQLQSKEVVCVMKCCVFQTSRLVIFRNVAILRVVAKLHTKLNA